MAGAKSVVGCEAVARRRTQSCLEQLNDCVFSSTCGALVPIGLSTFARLYV